MSDTTPPSPRNPIKAQEPSAAHHISVVPLDQRLPSVSSPRMARTSGLVIPSLARSKVAFVTQRNHAKRHGDGGSGTTAIRMRRFLVVMADSGKMKPPLDFVEDRLV